MFAISGQRRSTTPHMHVYNVIVLIACYHVFYVGFQVTAKLKEKYKIEYSVKNIHTDEICILIQNTMFDDNFWPAGVEVWKGDDIEPYASVVISLETENISPNSYKRIKSGVTMTVTRDLTDFFHFQANQMDYIF